MGIIARLEDKPGFHFIDVVGACWCGAEHRSVEFNNELFAVSLYITPEVKDGSSG